MQQNLNGIPPPNRLQCKRATRKKDVLQCATVQGKHHHKPISSRGSWQKGCVAAVGDTDIYGPANIWACNLRPMLSEIYLDTDMDLQTSGLCSPSATPDLSM